MLISYSRFFADAQHSFFCVFCGRRKGSLMESAFSFSSSWSLSSREMSLRFSLVHRLLLDGINLFMGGICFLQFAIDAETLRVSSSSALIPFWLPLQRLSSTDTLWLPPGASSSTCSACTVHWPGLIWLMMPVNDAMLIIFSRGRSSGNIVFSWAWDAHTLDEIWRRRPLHLLFYLFTVILWAIREWFGLTDSLGVDMRKERKTIMYRLIVHWHCPWTWSRFWSIGSAAN